MSKIDKKIVGYAVAKPRPTMWEDEESVPKMEVMNEDVVRPEMLFGSTYKIKPPHLENALYITINDTVLNEGTEHESMHPFEIFINSKNMEQFQWITALTRVMSAVFRKGGDCTFLVEEMKAVFDPKGGYWKKGGVFMPSLVAEIGFIVETHLKRTGLLASDEMDENQKRFLESKRAEFEAKHESKSEKDGYPEGATMCSKCNTKAVIMMDGCAVCLQCSDSKCG